MHANPNHAIPNATLGAVTSFQAFPALTLSPTINPRLGAEVRVASPEGISLDLTKRAVPTDGKSRARPSAAGRP